MKTVRIDAKGMHYTPLNQKIRAAVAEGAEEIIIDNVLGQRFIGDGLRGNVKITINGVPGGDLGMFMSGPVCVIHGNAEHAPGNTMDSGMLVIHGSAGDAVAHGMRGGKVFIRNNIGYRGGIHMKQYEVEKRPMLVIGGTAHSFLGEYMAGGLVLVFGMGKEKAITDRGIGSGIHGGEIIIRGEVDDYLLGVGAKKFKFDENDLERIAPVIKSFCECFGLDPAVFLDTNYTKIGPASSRPFASKYVWE